MTSEDRKAKIAELRAEADRLEREGKVKESAKNGDLFRSYGRIVLIPPSYPNTYVIALTGESIGCQCYGWEEDPGLEYLGHARDLLTIKTPDAPEPTGAELVGKVCELSISGKGFFGQGVIDAYNHGAMNPYVVRRSSQFGGDHVEFWRFARLAKDRP